MASALTTLQSQEYGQALGHVRRVAKALKRYQVSVKDTENGLDYAPKWPTNLLATNLTLDDDSDDAYLSDYQAPPRNPSRTGQKRGQKGKHALSDEIVVDSDDDTFDAEPVESLKKKRRLNAPRADDVEESPSRRKSTGGKGGPVATRSRNTATPKPLTAAQQKKKELAEESKQLKEEKKMPKSRKKKGRQENDDDDEK